MANQIPDSTIKEDATVNRKTEHSMFGKTVEEHEIGPLSYSIKRKGGRFTLWLGGCGIGRPRPDRPGEVWEYSAKTLTEARKEMQIDAAERLRGKIANTETALSNLRAALSLVDHPTTDEGK